MKKQMMPNQIAKQAGGMKSAFRNIFTKSRISFGSVFLRQRFLEPSSEIT